MNTDGIEFLTLAEVVEIHKNQVELYGGDRGIRDLNLLNSAIYFPCATFDSRFLHADFFDMAAEYIFYLFQNHPFIYEKNVLHLFAALSFLTLTALKLMIDRACFIK